LSTFKSLFLENKDRLSYSKNRLDLKNKLHYMHQKRRTDLLYFNATQGN